MEQGWQAKEHFLEVQMVQADLEDFGEDTRKEDGHLNQGQAGTKDDQQAQEYN